MTTPTPDLPTVDVCFIDDLAKRLRVSRATIERRRREHTFPIPELPALDSRPRWSVHAVEAYLRSTTQGLQARRGRPRRVDFRG